MNEQQLADLFSNQLDNMLQGQPPALPIEASELQELLDFGQQFSQVTFQPGPAAQAAFQGQLAAWFGPTPGGLATTLGLSKTLLFTIIVATILIGTGAGLAVLGVPSLDNSNGLSAPEAPVLPTATPQDTPKPPAADSESEATEPDAQPTPKATQSSLEETIPTGGNSSLGDTMPSSSTGETLSLPTPTPTATVEDDVTESDVSSGESTITDDTGDAGDGDTSGGDDSAPEGDHDKGHGNDADGIDEDNPGNSGDVLGGGGSGQGGGLGGLGRGDDNGGGGQGGQGGGGGQGQGGGKGGGQGKGKGKNK